jgi:hypothetical protein
LEEEDKLPISENKVFMKISKPKNKETKNIKSVPYESQFDSQFDSIYVLSQTKYLNEGGPREKQ